MTLQDFFRLNRKELYGHVIKVFCHDPKYEMEVLYSFDVLYSEVWKGYFDEYYIREVAFNYPLRMWIFELLHLELEDELL